MRRLALAALLCVACDPVPAELLPGVCGPAIIPLEVVSGPDVDPLAVHEAASFWPDLLIVDSSPSERWPTCFDGCLGVALVYHAELPDGVLGDTAHALQDDGRVIACEIRLTPWWDADARVLAHELGHCLGLDHTVDENSIMHTPVRPWSTPLDGEVANIRAGCDAE